MKTKAIFLLIFIFSIPCAAIAQEQDGITRLQKFREMREHRADGKRRMDVQPTDAKQDVFQGRDILLYTPSNLPAAGNRAMVVVLHGGMGNANHIYTTFGAEMNKAADEGGFVVAYLNGSQASRLGEKFHAWNAGGCCGQPSEKGVDDVAYITGAVKYLAGKYGIDSQKIYGMGHSNGAMMTQRLMCETDIYQAAIPISGPLALDTQTCPAAKGKRILSIHGTVDENVPINGGYGTKGLTKFKFISEEESQKIFTASGANYKIDAVEGADHSPITIMDKIQAREGRSFGQYAALFLGLAPKQ